MKTIFSIFLCSGFIINLQSQNDITISLVNADTMDFDSLFITVKYQNNMNDTLHLLNMLELREEQSIDFFSDDQSIICCGIGADISFPQEISTYPCNGGRFDVNIPPNNFLEKKFHLTNDLGYYGFTRGHSYTYRVELHIRDQFKTYCSNIWTGISCSNYGFFTILN